VDEKEKKHRGISSAHPGALKIALGGKKRKNTFILGRVFPRAFRSRYQKEYIGRKSNYRRQHESHVSVNGVVEKKRIYVRKTEIEKGRENRGRVLFESWAAPRVERKGKIPFRPR